MMLQSKRYFVRDAAKVNIKVTM